MNMHTFINSRNISATRLCEIITEAFPELHCSIDGDIVVRTHKDSAPLLNISMQENYGKVKVETESVYIERIFEVIGSTLTKNYDNTKTLVLFAEYFNQVPQARIELINDNNLSISLQDEVGLRLRLWLKKDGKAIEMQVLDNESGRVFRSFIEKQPILLAQLEIFHSGSLTKYISILK